MGKSTAALPPPAARFEGLDALRGIAAVLVIALHAATPYILHPMPGLVWPARDAAPSALVDGAFWAIEGFIMPLFFFLSGFFAWGLCRNLGPRAFVGHRVRRVLGPLLFGCVAILPLDFYAWALGFVADGRCGWRPLRSMKFPPEIAGNLWGLSHLWYLQYLFLCSLGLALAIAVVGRRNSAARPDESFDAVPARTFAMSPVRARHRADGRLSVRALATAMTLGMLGAMILFWEPNIVVGFQHSFLPVPPKFAYSLLYFAAGAWLAARDARIEAVRRSGAFGLVAALPLLLAALPLIHRQQLEPLAGADRAALATLTGLFAAMMTLGLFGAFLCCWTSTAGVWKLLADASFWIYLFHHPVVGLVQIDLSPLRWPAELKFLTVIAVTLGLTLASYWTLVRDTPLGALLNGRRKLRPVIASKAASGATRQAA